jgi:hypothetical protein
LTGTVVFAHPDQLTLSLAVSGMGITVGLDQQTVAVWDERDSQGHLVPGGVYQVLVEEKAGADSYFYSQNVSVVLSGQAALAELKAAPNLAHSGDTILLTASIDGQPAGAPAVIKIYTLLGELIRTLPLNAGQVSWNLENSRNQPAASGLYIVTLDGVNVAGSRVYKSLPVAIIR